MSPPLHSAHIWGRRVHHYLLHMGPSRPESQPAYSVYKEIKRSNTTLREFKYSCPGSSQSVLTEPFQLNCYFRNNKWLKLKVNVKSCTTVISINHMLCKMTISSKYQMMLCSDYTEIMNWYMSWYISEISLICWCIIIRILIACHPALSSYKHFKITSCLTF